MTVSRLSHHGYFISCSYHSTHPFTPFPTPSHSHSPPPPLSVLTSSAQKSVKKARQQFGYVSAALTQFISKTRKIPCVFLTYRHPPFFLLFFQNRFYPFFLSILSFRIKAYCVFRDCGLPYWLFSTSYLQSGGAMVFFFVNSSVLSLSAGGVWSKR